MYVIGCYPSVDLEGSTCRNSGDICMFMSTYTSSTFQNSTPDVGVFLQLGVRETTFNFEAAFGKFCWTKRQIILLISYIYKGCCYRNFWAFHEIFHNRLGSGLGMINHIRKCEENQEITLWPELCGPWSGSQFEMAIRSQCSYFVIAAGRGWCRSLNALLNITVAVLSNSSFRFD